MLPTIVPLETLPPKRVRRFWRIGCYVSGVGHLTAFSALVMSHVLAVELGLVTPETAGPDQQITLECRTWLASDVKNLGDVAVAMRTEALDVTPSEQDDVAKADVPSAPANKEQGTAPESGDVAVRNRIDATRKAAEKLSPEEQLAQLKDLGNKLTAVSSDESLDQLSGQLQKVLGTEERATKPAEKPVAGDFDFNSAQLHDVRREELPDGGVRYISTLLDSAGRTTETPLDDENGEKLFKLMELMKSNPLLEKIYRGIVMGMIDKLLKPDATTTP